MIAFWLSFADGRRPKGQQFLGCCIIEAPTFEAAHAATRLLRINPGGEVQAHEMRIPSAEDAAWLRPYMNRLLTRAQAEELDRAAAERFG